MHQLPPEWATKGFKIIVTFFVTSFKWVVITKKEKKERGRVPTKYWRIFRRYFSRNQEENHFVTRPASC